MSIAVLANGAWDPVWGARVLKDADFLICADGGANYAIRSGRIPDLLIGDLDSILPETLKKCEEMKCVIERYPCQKDETDLELALSKAEERASFVGDREVFLYGATGRRIDHFLGNLGLMLFYAEKGLRLCIADPEHKIWILHEREQIYGFQGQEISLIPLSGRAVVTTQGLYYPLDHDVLPYGLSRGISNVFLGEKATIEVHEGRLLAVQLTGENI